MGKAFAKDMAGVKYIIGAEAPHKKMMTVVAASSLGVICLIFGGLNLARFGSVVNAQTIALDKGYFGDGIIYNMGCGRNIPTRQGKEGQTYMADFLEGCDGDVDCV